MEPASTSSTKQPFDEKALYYATLLHVRYQSRFFTDAFIRANHAASLYDPEGTFQDPFVNLLVDEMVKDLKTQIALIPGLKQIFLLALEEAPASSESSSS